MLKKGKLLYQVLIKALLEKYSDSIKTSSTLGLKTEFTNLVNAYLMEEPTYGVFEISDAYILSYRWPQNGEYRDFLLTDICLLSNRQNTKNGIPRTHLLN